MSRAKEIRVVPKLEVRAVDGASPKLAGYAAKYNQPSEDLGGFIEYVRPGAFTKSLAENDIRALYNHDTAYVLGRNKAGTLRLSEDDTGLYFEIDLPDTQVARDLATSVARGDISGCSFGFYIREDEWETGEDGQPTHYLNDVDLFEISIVGFPAYPSTEVSVRSLQQFLKAKNLQRDQKTGLKTEWIASVIFE